jgi:hypothetical protein
MRLFFAEEDQYLDQILKELLQAMVEVYKVNSSNANTLLPSILG